MMIKRLMDLFLSGIGLIILSPLFLICSIWIKLDSRGPVYFRQVRVGRYGKIFRIFKFRTMLVTSDVSSAQITFRNDLRITRSGKYLRSYKIDELPQLINVIKGDMSLVGPRPEVPMYVKLYEREYENILKVKPGITDLASIKYKNESELLSSVANPELYYINTILPDKIHLAKKYISSASFILDIKLILSTLFNVRLNYSDL